MTAGDELSLLDETIQAIFAKHCTRQDRIAAGQDIPARLWTVLGEAGLLELGMPGSGGGLPELTLVARAVGRHAVPAPLVEAVGLASWLLGSSGLPLPRGAVTSAAAHPDDKLRCVRRSGGWSVDGVLHRVPWGRAADRVVAIAESDDGPMVAVLAGPSTVSEGRNLADEPRDTLHFGDVPLPADAVAPTWATGERLLLRGAFLRAAAMAGAMQRVLSLSVDYARDRQQFGRAIASFQAVQRHLVLIAEEAACAGTAVRAAARFDDEPPPLTTAMVKTTAGIAAQRVAAGAHQVHGAIGATEEYQLQWFTRRLWSWQDEFGSAQLWARRIGRDVLAAGAARLWPTISAPLDRDNPRSPSTAAHRPSRNP